MYCVMRASVPFLYNIYRRYDIHTLPIPSSIGGVHVHGVSDALRVPHGTCAFCLCLCSYRVLPHFIHVVFQRN